MTVLCLTLHELDDQRYQTDVIQSVCQNWLSFYDEVWVGVSSVTSKRLRRGLQDVPNTQVVDVAPNGVVYARKAILSAVVSQVSDDATLQLADFDRMVTWSQIAPEEFKLLTQPLPVNTHEILGRTARAFSSHPFEWRETERLTNLVSQSFFGIDDLDITAGSERFSADLVPLLLTSVAKMNDAEWPRMVKLTGGRVLYRSCEGLAYRPETNKSRISDSARELTARLRLAATITQSLYHA